MNYLLLCNIFQPRSYQQKEILAKIFVMRWVIACGIQLPPLPDNDDGIVEWCNDAHLL